jgi:hypothetical protein
MTLALLLAASIPAITPCPPLEQTLPPAFAVWASAWTSDGAWNSPNAPVGRRLVPGRAARIALVPFADSGIVKRPGYNERPNARGRRLSFRVARAGAYRIAIDIEANVDVVRNGRTLPSVYTPGPQCTAIYKIFDVQLERGRYELQIAQSWRPTVMVLIVPAA